MGSVQSVEVKPESIPLDEPTNEGESPAYRSIHCFKGNGGRLCSRIRSQPESETAIEVLEGTAAKYPDVPTFGERKLRITPEGKEEYGPYEFISYGEAFKMALAFGRGLRELGLKRGDNIGIYSHNSRYFQIVSFGAYSVGMTVVPVYDSLGPDAAHFIAEHSEIKVLFCSEYKMKSALEVISHAQNIEHFIFGAEAIPKDVECRIAPVTVQHVIELGQKSSLKNEYPSANDTAMIMYTSGTTGSPKGCVLTHRNILAGSSGFQNANLSGTPTDVYLSFLPLAHIMAQVVELLFIAQGIRIGYARGPVKFILEDILALQPTVVVFVPRVYNRVYDSMNEKINALPFYLQKAIRWAIHSKYESMKQNKPHSLLLDMILFKDFRNALGGRLRMVISGGAPLMPEVYEFLCGTVSPNIVQGYGMTEGCGGVSVQELPSDSPELIPVSFSCDMKLIAVDGNPDYDPLGKIPSGELLLRGPLVFQGYYKQPELTKEAFRGEWFRTGDVVQLINGKIKLVDRVKSIAKLSQGEYVSLTYLTELYSMAKDVAFVYIYVSPQHDKPSAAVVPTADRIKQWRSEGIKDIENNEKCIAHLLESLNEQFVKRKMRGFEKIDRILIDLEEPSVENGLLTPSMKPQAKVVKQRWDARLEALLCK